jgi:hypothetical protein
VSLLTSRYDVVLAFGIVLVAQLARVGFIALQDDATLVTMIPDDAFYYLVLARNFVSLGNWSFDGTAPATGFHLLWAYVLAGAHWLLGAPDLRSLFVLSAGAGAIMVAAAAGLVAATARRVFGPAGALGTTVVFFSIAGAQQATLLVEAPFVIVTAAAMAALMLRRDMPADGGTLLAAFGLGFVGMMARSDFGLLPAGILLAHAVAYLCGLGRRSALLAPASGLAGAVVGLAVVLAHAWIVSGGSLQASADVKFYWSVLAGHRLTSGIEVLGKAVLPIAPTGYLKWALVVFIISAAACTFVSWRSWHDRIYAMAFSISMLTVAATYIIYFRYNSQALQIWYAAHLVVPAAFLLGGAFAVLFDRLRPLGLTCLAILVGFCLVYSTRPVWPWQESMYQAGLFLRHNPEINPAAAWNAGIVSYFAGRPVINVDGLVNDDVVPYIKSGNLVGYLKARGVRYLVDSTSMFEGTKPIRGGYADGRLKRCIAARQPLVTEALGYQQEYASLLFIVDQDCLQKQNGA